MKTKFTTLFSINFIHRKFLLHFMSPIFVFNHLTNPFFQRFFPLIKMNSMLRQYFLQRIKSPIHICILQIQYLAKCLFRSFLHQIDYFLNQQILRNISCILTVQRPVITKPYLYLTFSCDADRF